MEYLTLHVVPRVDGEWRVTLNRLSTRAVMGHPKRIGVIAEQRIPVPSGASLDEVAGWLLARLATPSPRREKSWTDASLPGL